MKFWKKFLLAIFIWLTMSFGLLIVLSVSDPVKISDKPHVYDCGMNLTEADIECTFGEYFVEVLKFYPSFLRSTVPSGDLVRDFVWFFRAGFRDFYDFWSFTLFIIMIPYTSIPLIYTLLHWYGKRLKQ